MTRAPPPHTRDTPEFKGFKFPELVNFHTLQDFFNSLASLLATQVLEKCRRGLYRSYISQNATLGYVRGRIDIPKAIQKPWQIKIPCQYQENTHDNEDNQIIFYTLHRILRSQLCTENTQTKVNKAFHALQGYVNLYPFSIPFRILISIVFCSSIVPVFTHILHSLLFLIFPVELHAPQG